MKVLGFFLSLVIQWGLVTQGMAATADLPSIIEQFVAKQFPRAESHFWVVNQTEWGSQEELVVDLNTITQTVRSGDLTENRFLLLIVSGRLEASQQIPLGEKVHCKPEKNTT